MTTKLNANQKRAIGRLIKASDKVNQSFWKSVKLYKEPRLTIGIVLSIGNDLDKAIKLYNKHFNK